jgi:hypothetical protein
VASVKGILYLNWLEHKAIAGPMTINDSDNYESHGIAFTSSLPGTTKNLATYG